MHYRTVQSTNNAPKEHNIIIELEKELHVGDPVGVRDNTVYKNQQVSESNPWIETTPSVSLFYGGERVGAAEMAATDEAFCKLMGRVRVLARNCDDANDSAAGENFPNGVSLSPILRR